MPEDTKSKSIPDSLMIKLNREKEAALDFQKRRHIQWDDNYSLYRNTVQTNRLTQRQAVNIPLMKETIKTLLAKIDDPPAVTFKELTGDRTKELLLQARWEDDADRLNFDGIDMQDKKTVLLYGRGWKKLNWVNNNFCLTPLDIYDVVIDPLADPLDIETARYVIHQNIFRPLEEVMADPRYSSRAKKGLRSWMNTEEGIIQSQKAKEQLEAKNERLKMMGINDEDLMEIASSQVLLNLSEHYTLIWDEQKKEYVRNVVVYANDTMRLDKSTMKELLGVDFLPFVAWGEDTETQDFWSDGPADLVRVPNKILNIFLSQMIENRTLKNFQMHWYDATVKGYQPQTYEPGPGRMLPSPGNPNDVIMPVAISGLEDCLTQIDFLIRMVERGTSATAIEKGVSEKKQTTLGEVELLVGKAMERTQSLAKNYRRAWKELGMKYWQILDANDNKGRTLYKTSGKGKVWPKLVLPEAWKSKKGFRVESKSSAEQEVEKTTGIQKIMAVRAQFPNNLALQRIAQKRMLELIDVTPEEQREVEEEEKKSAENPQPQAPQTAPVNPAGQLPDLVPQGV